MAENSNAMIGAGDRALTFREAHERYGIPEHRLRQYRTERKIDFFKMGKAVFVSERSLLAFMERHREGAREDSAVPGTAVING